jgi:iron complex outermembrane recepter protein
MKQQLLQFFSIVAVLFVHVTFVLGQGTITGRLVDTETSEGLTAASLLVEGTTVGTITDVEGNFNMLNVPSGTRTLVISYVGYQTTYLEVTVSDGQTTDLGSVNVNPSSVGLSEVQVIASLAKDRRTPVAVSTIKGTQIEALVGNQEFPEILKNTPSVYVTKTGGGFGDARINIRGYDQNNVAVMINGIPVNDMENGWVYWSNWAGLSDVTSTMQIQRGLGASKLAVPSVGGSINIVTNAADFNKGGAVSVGVGNDGYQKYAVVLSSGKTEKGFAITAQATHTRGAMFAQGTDFQAYSYFLSASQKINASQSISATVVGAPQWHHQRTGATNFDAVYLQTFLDKGIDFNHNYGDLNGEQYTWRKNFYHKPKAFINHYWDINEKTNLKTSAYVSVGRGGGTGARGRLASPTTFDTFSGFSAGIHDENGQVRFNDIFAYNQGDSIVGGGFGAPDTKPFIAANANTNGNRDGFIRRASMNYHNWYGVLSTLESKISPNFTLVTGIDARYYKGEHFRRVEDLMGNTSYESFSDINNPGKIITTAAPADFGSFADNGYKDGTNVINYYNDGLVGWIGAFVQGEYTNDVLSAFVSLSGSNQSFKRIDYFVYEETDPARETDWQSFLGGTIKAGANYNLNETSNVFANVGFFSRQPIFDNVFINLRNDINENVQNQTVSAFEVGYGYNDGRFDIDVNAYYTEWGNRQFTINSTNANNETIQFNFNDVSQRHIGLEFEAKAKIIKQLDLTLMASVGDWIYASDFIAQGYNIDQQQAEGGADTLYLEGTKIGDAAQTTFGLGLNIYPTKGLSIYASYNYANNLYSQYNVLDSRFRSASFDENGDRVPNQVVKLPAYGLLDAGISYDFKIGANTLTVRINGNNLLDTQYVSEMFTSNEDDPNTPENEFYTKNQGFFGFGRTWNAGVKFKF